MTSHADVLERRRKSTTVRRWVDEHVVSRHAGAWGLGTALVLLLLLSVAFIAVPAEIPPMALAPFVVLAGLFLPLRWLWTVYGPVALLLLIAVPLRHNGNVQSVLIGLSTVTLMMMMVLLAASRQRVGLRGFTGESFFVDLRDRLVAGGQIPALPEPWRAESTVHAAYGDAFSGDFLVTALQDGILEVALVDVSGKGQGAGSRSLALSGALGGIIGSVTPERFLSAANAYVLRQHWDEGFATAIHLAIDLRTGEGSIGSAGHPPAVVHRSGSGLWNPVGGASGPLLGVMADLDFPRVPLQLGISDAVLIYSDGVIESRHADLSIGVDRMLGAAAEALLADSSDVAEAVVRSARAGKTDDRAAFVLRRG